MKLFALLTALVLVVSASSSKHSFKGYCLVKLNLKSAEEAQLVQQLRRNSDFDLWANNIKGHANETVSVLLSPLAFKRYSKIFDSTHLDYHIAVPDFDEILKEQEKSMNEKRSTGSAVGKYARMGEILSYIDNLVFQNYDLISSYVAGRSYENRELKVVVFKTPTTKRSVWIDCGIHAREWIAPSTCIWIIDRLLTDYRNNDPKVVKLLKYFEIHILPVLNPDGYEYTHTNYRMWRKNRSPNSGTHCSGTDLNRNSGYNWMTGGSSSDPCSDIYAGKSANSELEIQAVQNALRRKLGQWDSYLTLHSYGQWWFTTWGYTQQLPNDYYELERKGQIAVDAIRNVNGLNFVLGSSTSILGVASGGSEDWAKGVANIKYAYCLELRPGQYGQDSHYGFALPTDRIPKAGEEMYQGINAFLNSIVKN